MLENEIIQEKQSLQNCQNLSKDLMKEKAQLEKTIETLRENSERQVHKFLSKRAICFKYVNKGCFKMCVNVDMALKDIILVDIFRF